MRIKYRFQYYRSPHWPQDRGWDHPPASGVCAVLTPRLTLVFPIVRRGTPFPGILQRAIPSADVAEILKTLFPQLLVLMQISSIPMTSVDCERGFSAMNRIKTKTRNKLSNFVLDHLMRISLSKYSLAGFMEMHGISTDGSFP